MATIPEARRPSAGAPPRPGVAGDGLTAQLRELAASQLEPEDMIEPALQAVLAACGAAAGAVCLFDQRSEVLRLAAEVGLSDDGCRHLRSMRRGGLAGWDMPLQSLLNRRAYLIESAAKNRYVPPLVDNTTTVRTLACLPLYSGATALASVILIAQAPRSLDERDLRDLALPLRELVQIIEAVRRRAAGHGAPSAPAPATVLPSVPPLVAPRTAAPSPAPPVASPAAPAPAAPAPAGPGPLEATSASLATSERERARLAAALEQAAEKHASEVKDLMARLLAAEAAGERRTAEEDDGRRRVVEAAEATRASAVAGEEAARRELAETHTALATARDELARARGEVDRLVAAGAATDTAPGHLDEELAALRATAEAARAQAIVLEQARGAAEARAESLKARVGELEGEIGALRAGGRADLVAAEARREQDLAQARAAEAELRARVAGLERERGEAQACAEGLQERLGDLESEVEVLRAGDQKQLAAAEARREQDLAQARAAEAELRARVAAVERERGEVQARVAALEQDRAAAEARAGELQTRTAALEHEREEGRTREAALQARLAEAMQQAGDRQAAERVAALEQELATLRAGERSQQAAAEQAAAAAGERLQQLAEARAAAKTLRDRVGALERELDALRAGPERVPEVPVVADPTDASVTPVAPPPPVAPGAAGPPVASAGEPAPSAAQVRRIVVVDNPAVWRGVAVSGHEVKAIAPGNAAGAEIAGLSATRIVANLAAKGALGALASARAEGSRARFWGYVAPPDGARVLPLGMVEPAEAPLEPEAILGALAAYAAQGTRIVTVGDDADALISLRQALTRQGMSVSMAWNAKQAEDLLYMVRPEVVILDLRQSDGYRIVARLAVSDPVPTTILVHDGKDVAGRFGMLLSDPSIAGRLVAGDRLLATALGRSEAAPERRQVARPGAPPAQKPR